MYFVANWKMQLSINESITLAKKIKQGFKKVPKGVNVAVCPSFEAIEAVAKILKNSKIALGAQDMFWEKKGAYTGEVSAPSLKKLGCLYAILGHSERRRLGEKDADVRKKMIMALKSKITPIICVGETLVEKKAGKTKDVIIKQITAIFKNTKLGAKRTIIAYEPVWAIGTGIPARPKDAAAAKDLILGLLKRYLKKDNFKKISVIYGGSVSAKNIAGFLKTGKMEGALVGGASLSAKEFIKIINSV